MKDPAAQKKKRNRRRGGKHGRYKRARARAAQAQDAAQDAWLKKNQFTAAAI